MLLTTGIFISQYHRFIQKPPQHNAFTYTASLFLTKQNSAIALGFVCFCLSFLLNVVGVFLPSSTASWFISCATCLFLIAESGLWLWKATNPEFIESICSSLTLKEATDIHQVIRILPFGCFMILSTTVYDQLDANLQSITQQCDLRCYMKAQSKPSSHSSSRFSSRKGSKEPPPTSPYPTDPILLAQLQQMQLAQLQQHGHLPNYPPMVYPIPTQSSSRSSNDEAPLILQQLEAKETRMAQLSALLEAMKQETSGTTEAMQKTLQEMEKLQQKNNDLSQQVDRGKEALAAQQVEHTFQLEQLIKAVEDERKNAQVKFEMAIQEKQKELDAIKHKLDCEITLLSNGKVELQHEINELQQHCDTLQENRETLDSQVKAIARDLELVRDEYDSFKSAMNLKLNEIESEKQELARHLSATFQDLDRSRSTLIEVNTNAAQLASKMAENELSWRKSLEAMETQRNNAIKETNSMVATNKAFEDALQVERNQKSELNAAMRTELQRYTDEMHSIELSNSQTTTQLQQELSTTQKLLKEAEQNLVILNDELQTKAGITKDELRQLQKSIDLKDEALEAYVEANTILQTKNNETETRVKTLETEMETSEFARRTVEDRLKTYSSILMDLASQTGVNLSTVDSEPMSESQTWSHNQEEFNHQLRIKEEELENVKQDCSTLALEIQNLASSQASEKSMLSQTFENKINGLETSLQATTLQNLQLTRTTENQKQRMLILEQEKRELLEEAEQLNQSLSAMFQGKNSLQEELDAAKSQLLSTQTQLSDLQESHDQLQTKLAEDIACLQSYSNEKEKQYQDERSKMTQELSVLVSKSSQMEIDLQSSTQSYNQLCQENELNRQHLIELNDAFDQQTRALDEAKDNAAEWKDKAETLSTSTANMEGTLKIEVNSYSAQCVALSGENKRLEVALKNLQSQSEQTQADIQAFRLEKKNLQQLAQEREDALLSAQNEIAHYKAEIDRLQRLKQNLQSELSRMNDEVNEQMRQVEVLRREIRNQEKAYIAQEETYKKDIEIARQDAMEAVALNDEMQAKMSTIQAAANATINDLVAELTHAEEALKTEKTNRLKEEELLRTQCRYMEEDVKRKEIEWRESTAIIKRESTLRKEHIETLESKFQKQKDTLETKKAEVDKLTKEVDQKQFKIAELERKLAPLLNTKETLSQRLVDLKQTLESKTREHNDTEEKLRSDIAKLQKEKRELESLHARHQEESDKDSFGRFASMQTQLVNENKVLKTQLERYKQDLHDASQNVLTLAHRLENLQSTSNNTISDLSGQLQSSEHQYRTQTATLERDLNLAREQIQELNITRQLLQKELRRLQAPSNKHDDGMLTVRTTASQPECRPLVVDTEDSYIKTSRSDVSLGKKTIDPFDAKESLADIPVALLRAQIGLDLSKPAKATNNQVEVPYLPLDQIDLHHHSMPHLGLSSERNESDILEPEWHTKVITKKAKALKSLKGKKSRLNAVETLPKLV
ncbi:plectin [Thraustotheca clavata]|uniref:Plectin n=1 Tax=Thraustotheca clavata TaxID=74557 RepID=A0A1V9ZV28_9STRA|nr:plectin [Thraustotheca clavata]